MKKDVAKKWVAALRSGKYNKGKGQLQVLDTYCCLGVLCKIAPRTIKKHKHPDNTLIGGDLLSQPEVHTWSGMNKFAIYALSLSGMALLRLIDMNDSQDNFDKIAAFIEKHWEAL
jgi:hypothetical protein